MSLEGSAWDLPHMSTRGPATRSLQAPAAALKGCFLWRPSEEDTTSTCCSSTPLLPACTACLMSLQTSHPGNETNNNVTGFEDLMSYEINNSPGLCIGTSFKQWKFNCVFFCACSVLCLCFSHVKFSSRVTRLSREKSLSYSRDEGFFFLFCICL